MVEEGFECGRAREGGRGWPRDERCVVLKQSEDIIRRIGRLPECRKPTCESRSAETSVIAKKIHGKSRTFYRLLPSGCTRCPFGYVVAPKLYSEIESPSPPSNLRAFERPTRFHLEGRGSSRKTRIGPVALHVVDILHVSFFFLFFVKIILNEACIEQINIIQLEEVVIRLESKLFSFLELIIFNTNFYTFLVYIIVSIYYNISNETFPSQTLNIDRTI